jgi:hypothetical protein
LGRTDQAVAAWHETLHHHPTHAAARAALAALPVASAGRASGPSPCDPGPNLPGVGGSREPVATPRGMALPPETHTIP